MRFLKYNIPNWESEKIKLDGIACDVVVLGDTSVISSSAIDPLDVHTEGTSLPLPAPTGVIAVDILWHDEELPDFAQFRVYPSACGVHTFAGLEYLYTSELENHSLGS